MDWTGFVLMVARSVASVTAMIAQQSWHLSLLQAKTKQAPNNFAQRSLTDVIYGLCFLCRFVLWCCAAVIRSYLSHNDARQFYCRVRERRAHRRFTPFVYSETLSSSQIRLLRIRGWRSGLLNCSLECYQLNTCPRFAALSYTWESPRYESLDAFLNTVLKQWRSQPGVTKTSNTPHHRIVMCNGMALPITSNLYDALRSTHAGNQTSYWWVDQVCINQANIREKNNQIPQMGQVYGQANKVIAWLGLPGIFEKRIPDFLRQSLVEGQISAGIFPVHHGMTLKGLVVVLGLLLLLDRSWFRRAWIVQEFVLAGDVTFFLGSEEISLQQLMQIDSMVQDYIQWFGLSAVATLNYTTNLLKARRTYDRSSGWTFEYWIQICRGRRASDRRDLIFSGRSLLSTNEKLRIPIDYSTDESTVFSRLEKDLLSGDNGIESLFLAERREHSQIYQELQYPKGSSWEVNLDYPIPYSSMVDTRFSADPSSKRTAYTILRNGSTTLLQIEALVIDTTEAVCSPEDLSRPTGYRGLLSMILLMGERYRWTHEHPFVALARTLTADQTTEQDTDLIHSIVSMLSTAADEAQSVYGLQTTYSTINSPDFDEHKPQPLAYKGLHSYDLLLGLMYAFPHPAWEKPWPRVPPNATWTEMTSHKHVANSLAIVPTEDRFYPLFKSENQGRFLFRTHKGIIGRGPASVKPGDCVVILRGSRVPYVLQTGSNEPPEEKMKLRDTLNAISIEIELLKLVNLQARTLGGLGPSDPTQSGMDQVLKSYQAMHARVNGKFFLGEAYLHGFMKGEIQDWIDRGKVSWQTIQII